ncbi:unnamed protein product, partial [marine sediment metagenome]
IRLIPYNNLNNSIIIMYHSSIYSNESFVEYYSNYNMKQSFKSIFNVSNVSETYVYNVKIKELTPNTIYYYQINLNNEKREIMSFKTISNDFKKLNILVIADTQGIDKFNNIYDKPIINKLYYIKSNKYDMIIHEGDIISHGNNQREWNNYFEKMEFIHSKKVCLFTQGNHDTMNIYNNIITEYSYIKEFGNLVSIICLNTELDVNNDLVYNYLNNSNVFKHKIVFFHKPIFNNRIKRKNLDNNWSYYFNLSNVNIVFNGHNHWYEKLLINNTFYITCPSLIGSLKDSKFHNKTNELISFKNEYGFILMEITNNNIKIDVIFYKKGNYVSIIPITIFIIGLNSIILYYFYLDSKIPD